MKRVPAWFPLIIHGPYGQADRATKAWIELAFAARRGKLVTYTKLAKRLGYDSRVAAMSLRHTLDLLSRFCIAHGLPPINAIVVSKATRQPGCNVKLPPSMTPEEATAKVLVFPWSNFPFPGPDTFQKFLNAETGGSAG